MGDTKETVTIQELFSLCRAGFVEAINSLPPTVMTTPLPSTVSINEQFDRLKIWADDYDIADGELDRCLSYDDFAHLKKSVSVFLWVLARFSNLPALLQQQDQIAPILCEVYPDLLVDEERAEDPLHPDEILEEAADTLDSLCGLQPFLDDAMRSSATSLTLDLLREDNFSVVIQGMFPQLEKGLAKTLAHLRWLWFCDKGIKVLPRSHEAEATLGSERINFEPGFPKPHVDNSSQISFKCHICSRTVRMHTQEAWREHVLEDLQPYTCFDETCPDYRQPSYGSRNQWISHMAGHPFLAVKWKCTGTCGTVLEFRKQPEFLSHVLEHHISSIQKIDDSILSEMARRHAFTERITLAKLNPCDDYYCFFCGFAIRPNRTQSIILHIGRHLEDISVKLFQLTESLPDVMDDKTSSPSHSLKRAHTSRGSENQGDGLRAVIQKARGSDESSMTFRNMQQQLEQQSPYQLPQHQSPQQQEHERPSENPTYDGNSDEQHLLKLYGKPIHKALKTTFDLDSQGLIEIEPTPDASPINQQVSPAPGPKPRAGSSNALPIRAGSPGTPGGMAGLDGSERYLSANMMNSEPIADSEILAAIPPEGTTTDALVALFHTRLADPQVKEKFVLSVKRLVESRPGQGKLLFAKNRMCVGLPSDTPYPFAVPKQQKIEFEENRLVDTKALSAIILSFNKGNGKDGETITGMPPTLHMAYGALDRVTNKAPLDQYLEQARKLLEQKTQNRVNIFLQNAMKRAQLNQQNTTEAYSSGPFMLADSEWMREQFEQEEAKNKMDLDSEIYIMFENEYVGVTYKEVESQLEELGGKWYEEVKNWLLTTVPGQDTRGTGTALEYHLSLEAIDLLNKFHVTMEEHEHVLQSLVTERNERHLQISAGPLFQAGEVVRAIDAERRYWINEQERQIGNKIERAKRVAEHRACVDRVGEQVVEGLRKRYGEVLEAFWGVVWQFHPSIQPILLRKIFDENTLPLPNAESPASSYTISKETVKALAEALTTLGEIVALIKLAMDLRSAPAVQVVEAQLAIQVAEEHVHANGITAPTVTATACAEGLKARLPAALERVNEECRGQSEKVAGDLTEVVERLRVGVEELAMKDGHLDIGLQMQRQRLNESLMGGGTFDIGAAMELESGENWDTDIYADSQRKGTPPLTREDSDSADDPWEDADDDDGSILTFSSRGSEIMGPAPPSDIQKKYRETPADP